MRVEEIFQAYADYIMPTYTKVPLVAVKGKGSRLWDIHNKAYLDFFPGWGVGNLGHCHPKVMQAVRDQVSKLIFVPNNYYHPPQAHLAKELVYRSYPAKIFFCNSGTEANEGAIKFCRKFGTSTQPSVSLSADGVLRQAQDASALDKLRMNTEQERSERSRTIGRGRYEIITFENSFHGRTLGSLAATGQKKYQDGFEPLPEGFRIVRFNDIDAVRQAVTEKTVAVMLELIQGEGGVNVADKGFVTGLQELCRQKNLLLIIDEVQTGIGRTGKFFCYQHYGITPDIMTLAKALGGGFPIGVMVVKKEIADTLGPGMHASTFGGGPVICKAALAVLRAIQKERLLANAQRMGEYLFSELRKLQKQYSVIRDVRGIGLMAGVELAVDGADIVTRCRAKGLLINCTHGMVLRLMPALQVTRQQVNKAVRILGSVLADEKRFD